MGHIVLLGDSVFDNAAYTGPEPDVITHLRSVLPPRWKATLCAVDGATTTGLLSQVRCVPADATHLIVSVGGNDALSNIDLLSLSTRSTAEALTLFGRRVATFEQSYRRGLAPVLALRKPLTVCTIYNGDLPDREQAALARVALMLFNDTIFRVACEHRLTAIDLRLICSEAEDYANPIEPSGQGGLKIATAVARAIGAIPAPTQPAKIWGLC
jgi:hypothetical protein